LIFYYLLGVKKRGKELDVVVNCYNPSPWEAKAEESITVQGQSGQLGDFQAHWLDSETLSKKKKGGGVKRFQNIC
jgi:hypothetical protein